MAGEVVEENMFLFGLTVDQVENSRGWYSPKQHYENEPATRSALTLIFPAISAATNREYSSGWRLHRVKSGTKVNLTIHNSKPKCLADDRRLLGASSLATICARCAAAVLKATPKERGQSGGWSCPPRSDAAPRSREDLAGCSRQVGAAPSATRFRRPGCGQGGA